MKSLFRHNKGIGLVEILITMVVLAVGILGVAGLNSVIFSQSQDNKAHAEALAIAQSRIETIRNYTDGVTTLAEFNLRYGVVANGNSTTEDGMNATYTRTENITANGLDRNFEVNVAWTNADGVSQSVTLDTTLAFISPRGVGDSGLANTTTPVNAPTGRASIDGGTVPTGASTPSNNDTTALYQDGDDLKLVDCADATTCEQIVLTLALACQSDTDPCTQFVRIKGKVYLNTSVSGARPDPKDIYLVASDAAFCARYYMLDGTPVKVTEATTAVSTIGDYDYFNYTCYVGGGWHGNIGLVFAGSGTNTSTKFSLIFADDANASNNGYRVCTGDPTSLEADEAPRVAVRRAYRGLLFKKDPSDASARVQILDDFSQPTDRLYSHGIHDGLELGESTESHDFVIGKIDDVATDCLLASAMKGDGSDANGDGELGDLFAGQPRDFFCLNDSDSYLDLYDTAVYGHDDYCVFDPTNPPSTKHLISGVVRLTADQNAYTQGLAEGITVHTSDGIPCTNPSDPAAPLAVTYSSGYYEAAYSCNVYDWGTVEEPIGWTGYIALAYDNVNMVCSPNKITYTTGITSDDSSGNDFTGCTPGQAAVFTGSVTQAGTGQHTNKIISQIVITGTGTSAGINGTCSIAIGGLSYLCVSDQFSGTWSGNLTFTAGGTSTICPNPAASPKTFSFSSKAPGSYVQNLTIVANNGNGC